MSDANTPQKKGWFTRLREGLSRSTATITSSITGVFTKKKLDSETLDALEEALIRADCGAAAAAKITEAVGRGRYDKEIAEDELKAVLAAEIGKVLAPADAPLDLAAATPFVILVVGVNGAGKTTTIGKLAGRWKAEGRKVLVAAGDTFRAAAIEQLVVWGERAGVPVLAKAPGADAAGLAFEAVEKAAAEGFDIVMIDTAGRLQNKAGLMAELAKIVRVLRKKDAALPHETLLVLDATTGQNAVAQADAFMETAGVSGIVMTKLDGTAKGGVLVAIAEKFALPVRFIGVGETIDDLQPFEAQAFARALAGAPVQGAMES